MNIFKPKDKVNVVAFGAFQNKIGHIVEYAGNEMYRVNVDGYTLPFHREELRVVK